MRYSQIASIIELNKPARIVEVGTWNGQRAMEMVQEALKHQERVHYTGFDLFELATEETDARELNVKAHNSIEAVTERLSIFQAQKPGFTFTLVAGDTNKTLSEYDFVAPVDLAFIDGGHSIETIASDFSALCTAKVVVLDDYYEERDTEEFGCNSLVADLEHKVLPMRDPVLGGGFVRMVQIGGIVPDFQQQIVIKTKNCVPDEMLHSNIRHFLANNISLLPLCRAHGERVVFVNGGPDFHKHIDEIRTLQQDGAYVVAVKHAHDYLIDEGIIPFACMLLDPRDHVTDFIENPHSDVLYFVASQCHPTTLDQLLNNDAMILGYHAVVGAGEEEVIKAHDANAIMFAGGSTSATRGMSVFYGLGFRQFILFGFDCCYWPWEDIDMDTLDAQNKPKYFKCTVNGREFLTDAENIAQTQDFEKAMKQLQGADFDVRGDGMVPHVWEQLKQSRVNFSDAFPA